MTVETITLSVENLQEWASAKAATLDKIARLRKEADSYSNKIRAYTVLAEDSLDDFTKEWANIVIAAAAASEIANAEKEAEKALEKSGPALIDAIENVLREANKPLTHSEIRSLLPSVGFTEPVTSATGYFYTAIKRLIERGFIKRTDDDRLETIVS